MSLMNVGRLCCAVLASLVVSSTASAQTTVSTGTGGGGSPHVKSTWKVGTATISIEYGRPYLKGRAESKMMPIGQPWRTGADQATVITTDKMLMFGQVMLQPGSYTINTQPGEKGWELIIGKLEKPGQWGIPYRKDLEIGRAPMTLTKAAKPVEQVTISIDSAKPTLSVAWGTVLASIPFMVH